jgi:hypothetical protein
MDSPISKITRTKWTGGVTQVVELLLCKGKALGSNSGFFKRKKERKEKCCRSLGHCN